MKTEGASPDSGWAPGSCSTWTAVPWNHCKSSGIIWRPKWPPQKPGVSGEPGQAGSCYQLPLTRLPCGESAALPNGPWSFRLTETSGRQPRLRWPDFQNHPHCFFRVTKPSPRCPANKASRSASSLPSASPNIHPSGPLRPRLPAPFPVPLRPPTAVSPAAVFLALETAAPWCATGSQGSASAGPSLPSAVRGSPLDVLLVATALGTATDLPPPRSQRPTAKDQPRVGVCPHLQPAVPLL